MQPSRPINNDCYRGAGEAYPSHVADLSLSKPNSSQRDTKGVLDRHMPVVCTAVFMFSSHYCFASSCELIHAWNPDPETKTRKEP